MNRTHDLDFTERRDDTFGPFDQPRTRVEVEAAIKRAHDRNVQRWPEILGPSAPEQTWPMTAEEIEQGRQEVRRLQGERAARAGTEKNGRTP
ncbi:MAG: hypothetical protein GX465_18195 [Acidobacteria bacterium]|nr:hypothetical protein [Acidobacteriota bacterium]